MTPPRYTDNDIRSEAAHCLTALGSLPTVPDIIRWLPEAYVDSYREEDGSGQTWGEVLDDVGLVAAARKIHELIASTIPLPRWAVDLHADGLEPSEDHIITLSADEKPIARIHFAFEPGMDDDMRASLVQGIGQAIDAHLPEGGGQ